MKEGIEMSQHFVLYQHAGSGNHGCEALVRTVISTINSVCKDATFSLISSDVEADINYGLDEIENLKLIALNKKIKKGNLNWFILQLGKILNSNTLKLKASFNTSWMKQKDTVYIAIGGDNYCYNKGKSFFIIDDAIGGKKILWGCSIEPDDLDSEMIQHLRQFNVISAREPISYQALKDKNLSNVIYAPDTAFNLPTTIRKKTHQYVGINISPMILNYAKNADIIIKNYQKLIDYILKSTDMDIMFIPHVVSENNDDRIAIKQLVSSLDIPDERYIVVSDQNCMGLKGWIGMCDFFIGARTHSTIAAYSQSIPTLVMGYSVKSAGIAEDLFETNKNYVIKVNSLEDESALVDSFKWMLGNSDKIKDSLEIKVKEKQKQIFESYKKIIKE